MPSADEPQLEFKGETGAGRTQSPSAVVTAGLDNPRPYYHWFFTHTTPVLHLVHFIRRRILQHFLPESQVAFYQFTIRLVLQLKNTSIYD